MYPSLLHRKQSLRSKKQTYLDRSATSVAARSRAKRVPAAALALVSQAALVLSLSVPSVSVKAEPQDWVCPMYLMDFECVQYRQRLEAAANEDARRRIDLEYRLVIEDRRQACLCNVTQEQLGTLVQAGQSLP